jgi:lysosomal alpha-mannosidase
MSLISALVLILSLFFTTITAECGYSLCHKTDPKKLNIHLIAHSHDDVGWHLTPDAYYILEVRTIITNYMKSLQVSPNRKFTQVEIYFFHRWWSEQNEETKNQVKKLVNNGQLVFTNGGWCVNDEGVAHYHNIIDQMTFGLRFLDDEFGKCGHPKISWQIDPFGHSKEMASLFAQMGFDAHVINRGAQKGEFIWKGSKDLGPNSEIFTTVLHHHYDPPNGFDFETGNDLTDANKAAKAAEFVRIAQTWNNDYGNTSQVLMPMGSDFRYQNAERWFTNMDKLIEEITATHKDVNIFYSTPNCYIHEVNNLNKTYSQRDVDYFNYWAGYYSNRPTLKRQDRVNHNYIQVI